MYQITINLHCSVFIRRSEFRNACVLEYVCTWTDDLLHTRRLILPYIFLVRLSTIVHIFFLSLFLVDEIETEIDVGWRSHTCTNTVRCCCKPTLFMRTWFWISSRSCDEILLPPKLQINPHNQCQHNNIHMNRKNQDDENNSLFVCILDTCWHILGCVGS